MKLNLLQKKDVAHKTVLVRTDYNVPLEKIGEKWQVTDPMRISRSLETLNFLVKNQAKVVIITHLGRPQGQFKPELSTQPLAQSLAELMTNPVQFCSAQNIDEMKKFIDQQVNGSVIVLENIRSFPDEKKNSAVFARHLSTLGDVYINEAFSASHRAHASIVGLPKYLPSFAGFAFDEEVKTLFKLITTPQRPLLVIVGGAKISDKVEAIKNLVEVADAVLVGGGAANNFLAAEGYDVASSYLEEKIKAETNETDFVHFAHDLIEETKQERILKDNYIPLPKIIFPTDVIAADSPQSEKSQIIELFGNDAEKDQPDQLMYLDIGPKTIQLFKDLIAQAGSIFWNGPLGVFEEKKFATGTTQIAQAIAESKAYSVVGGGDTLHAIDELNLSDKFDYVSAAGGAALEFLSGKILPGMRPLIKK